ncbi:hypothetical protein LWI29_022738 [Acer saccharum]|uniref:Uncharacterized protein n=1 Tax=Acer saccharum TaxID=4024 RepID=A0AA39VBP6_ACESA|nr:hypothetical protein LWI29_022738 [Acer saccharum]
MFYIFSLLGLCQFPESLRPAKNLKKYGSWALVTAPTDGIGKAFAFELARKGLNLVLVGRNPDKLKDVSDSIRAKYAKTLIKSIVMDFSGDLDEGVIFQPTNLIVMN